MRTRCRMNSTPSISGICRSQNTSSTTVLPDSSSASASRAESRESTSVPPRLSSRRAKSLSAKDSSSTRSVFICCQLLLSPKIRTPVPLTAHLPREYFTYAGIHFRQGRLESQPIFFDPVLIAGLARILQFGAQITQGQRTHRARRGLELVGDGPDLPAVVRGAGATKFGRQT